MDKCDQLCACSGIFSSLSLLQEKANLANLATSQLDEGGLAGQIREISDVRGEDEVVMLASHHISGLDLRFGFIARVSSVNKKLHPRLKISC